MKTTFNYNLSKDDTLIIKGIAICAMLWHHLFFTNPEYGNFVFQTAQLGKVCVSLFLFVSAYGLAAQYSKICNKPIADTFRFQAKRFVKFYANYWVIFLIFVPIGVFVFGRPLAAAYGGGHWLKMLFTDFFGINGFQSYNITWRFNQLIIYLYLLFPLLYFTVKKAPILTLIFGIVIWKLKIPLIPIGADMWLLHFILGIVVALNVNKISDFLNRFNKYLVLFGVVLLFGILVVQRIYSIVPFFVGIKVDAFLAPIIAVLAVMLFRNMKYINTGFQFLGKHSMNIFMIHTFVFYYWFKDFIYLFGNPILIFVVLMSICLIISVALEYLKKAVCLPQLVKTVSVRIDNMIL